MCGLITHALRESVGLECGECGMPAIARQTTCCGGPKPGPEKAQRASGSMQRISPQLFARTDI